MNRNTLTTNGKRAEHASCKRISCITGNAGKALEKALLKVFFTKSKVNALVICSHTAFPCSKSVVAKLVTVLSIWPIFAVCVGFDRFVT